jgi:hypothetical protein
MYVTNLSFLKFIFHIFVCYSYIFYQHILLTSVYLEEISRKQRYRVRVQTMVQK